MNCGATIIGDRNIVGPGLGDIARQMQIAQRNQAALLAQQRAAAMAAGQAQKMASPQNGAGMSGGVFFSGRPMGEGAGMAGVGVGVATPPMSRSSSLNSEVGGKKRKAGGNDSGEGAVGKRRC